MTIIYTSHKRCKTCSLRADVVQQIHEVIWDVPKSATSVGPEQRFPTAAANARRVYRKLGVSITDKSIYSHIYHVEESAHEKASTSDRGSQLLSSDYQSLTDRFAAIGADALNEIANRLPEMKDRELVTVAKSGLQARQTQEALRLKERDATAMETAILLMASGFLTDQTGLPEESGMVINVSPIEADLRSAMEQERDALLLNAGYGSAPEE